MLTAKEKQNLNDINEILERDRIKDEKRMRLGRDVQILIELLLEDESTKDFVFRKIIDSYKRQGFDDV